VPWNMPNNLKILFLGDIVGKPARRYLQELIPKLRKEYDFIIANGENAAGGSGLTEKTAQELFACGIDVLSGGDHTFKKREALAVLEREDVLRPLNFPPSTPGRGLLIKEKGSVKLAVVNLLGRVFLPPADCPFRTIDRVIPEIKKETPVIMVDFHAEATSEKLALGYFLAGKVSAVLGTHTHIPTADARIIDGYTAYITDVGMTGSFDSVLGRRKEDIIERFLTNLPQRFNLAEENVRAQGVVLEIDSSSGRALKIERVEFCQDEL